MRGTHPRDQLRSEGLSSSVEPEVGQTEPLKDSLTVPLRLSPQEQLVGKLCEVLERTLISNPQRRTALTETTGTHRYGNDRMGVTYGLQPGDWLLIISHNAKDLGL